MTRQYVRDLIERTVATFLQGALGSVALDVLASGDPDALRAAAIGGVAALLAVVKGWAARTVGDSSSAALLPERKG
jgi:hypothetical protein